MYRLSNSRYPPETSVSTICFARRSGDFARLGHVFRRHQFAYSAKHIANREGGDSCNLYAFDLDRHIEAPFFTKVLVIDKGDARRILIEAELEVSLGRTNRPPLDLGSVVQEQLSHPALMQ